MKLSLVMSMAIMLCLLFGVFTPSLRKPVYRFIFCALCLGALLLSSIETQAGTYLRIFWSSWLLLLAIPFASGKAHIMRICVACCFGGVIGWRLIDSLSLFPELELLACVPVVLLSFIYGKTTKDRLLTALIAPIVVCFCFALSDYLLFEFCVVSLGSEFAFGMQLGGVFAVLGLERLWLQLKDRGVWRKQGGDKRGGGDGKDDADAAGEAAYQL